MSKEYIEREAAIKMIEEDLPEVLHYRKEDAIECLECLPSADVVETELLRLMLNLQHDKSLENLKEYIQENDVVKIIRCKDCKYCNKYTNWNNQEYLGCSWNGEIYEVEAEHYCSYGKRRTEDE